MEFRSHARWHRVLASIEIDAPTDCVFERWSRYEALPRVMRSVRRVKCIDEGHVLWDVDIAGRQVVWEARILEAVPEKRIRWESRWEAPHRGELIFDALPGQRTRLSVDLEFRPRGLLERFGARLGVVETHVRRDLALFRRAVENGARDASAR